jgi:CTP synthase
LLQARGLDDYVLERFELDCPPADLSEWDAVIHGEKNPEREVRIAMVGKYMELIDAYKSLNEALHHAGIGTRTKVKISYIDSQTIETEGVGCLADAHGILVPGGFGNRGVEGKIKAVKYARENKIPYLGICLGMQVAVIEYARHVAGLSDANSTEFEQNTSQPVVGLITEWIDESGNVEQRNEDSDLGGTMRLGAQICHLEKDSTTASLYGASEINERHRHRYEVNNNFLDQLRDAGLRVGGWSADKTLVEVVEVPDHPWFVACQFHPEFNSTPRDGHPLFTGFIQAANCHKSE